MERRHISKQRNQVARSMSFSFSFLFIFLDSLMRTPGPPPKAKGLGEQANPSFLSFLICTTLTYMFVKTVVALNELVYEELLRLCSAQESSSVKASHCDRAQEQHCATLTVRWHTSHRVQSVGSDDSPWVRLCVWEITTLRADHLPPITISLESLMWGYFRTNFGSIVDQFVRNTMYTGSSHSLRLFLSVWWLILLSCLIGYEVH